MHQITKERIQQAIGLKLLEPDIRNKEIARCLGVRPQVISNYKRRYKAFFESETQRIETLLQCESDRMQDSVIERYHFFFGEIRERRDTWVERFGVGPVYLAESIAANLLANALVERYAEKP